MAGVYQEFPKWKYHRTKGSKIVENASEERKLGRGWRDKPIFQEPSRFSAFLEQRVKPWWTKWQWLFAAIAVVSGIITTLVNLLRRADGK